MVINSINDVINFAFYEDLDHNFILTFYFYTSWRLKKHLQFNVDHNFITRFIRIFLCCDHFLLTIPRPRECYDKGAQEYWGKHENSDKRGLKVLFVIYFDKLIYFKKSGFRKLVTIKVSLMSWCLTCLWLHTATCPLSYKSLLLYTGPDSPKTNT